MRVVAAGGAVIELGETETGPTVGITDYSRRVTDDFGVTTVVERGFSRRMSVRLALATADADLLQRRVAAMRAQPAQWIADDRFASLSVQGFYKDFSLDLATPSVSFCTLTVEGLAETATSADSGIDPAPGLPSTLKLLQPVTVTDALLTASNVPEADYPEWAFGTTYALGAHVMKAATHRIYESAAAGNVGHDPAGPGGFWVDIGPTNRWAMFDQALGSLTEKAASIVVTIDPVAAVTAVALLDVTAATVRVQAAGYDHMVAPAAAPGMAAFLDMPVTTGPVTITATGAGTVSIGTLLIGSLVMLGITEASPTAGITDYSRKETDDFGEVTVVERAWAKRMSVRALIRTDAVDGVVSRIAAVRARPSLWIGDDALESVSIYGFFKDFSIEVGEGVSTLSLSIEGLSAAAKVAPIVDWPDVGDPTGTKPADNADVTGDNTSKDTAAVNGRSAADIIATMDVNTLGILEQALRQDDFLQVVQAWAFAEGQPVSTGFLNFRNEQRGINEASAAEFSSIFAKGPTGTGYTMNLEFVKAGTVSFKSVLDGFTTSISGINTSVAGIGTDISGLTATTGGLTATAAALTTKTNGLATDLFNLGNTVGTLSTQVSGVVAESASTKVATTLLQEAFATDGGGYARFVLKATIDGAGKVTIAGVSGVTTANDSELNFAANNFNFVRDDGGSAIKLLAYNGPLNRWEFTADVYAKKIVADVIETNHLKAGAVTGLTSYSFSDQAVGASEITLAEVTGLVIGDGVDGRALAMVSFTQDGSTTVDTSQRIRAYVDVGSGYVLVRNKIQGIAVASGSARWVLSQSFPVSLMGSGAVSLKITAQGNSLAGGPTSGSYARDIQVDIFQGHADGADR